MKTKLYTLLTGLLMAACITSYGQEITNVFSYDCNKMFSYNDLLVCSDGSVLSGIYCFSPSIYGDPAFHVCKVSPEGQLLDSTTFDSAWEILGIPRTPDTFVLPNFIIDNADSTLSITMTFIDANLNITGTVTTSILNGFDPREFMQDYMIISPVGDLIVTYWIDDVYHFARIGLDGTLIASTETAEILPDNPNPNYNPPAGSALRYESFGLFTESPERFYKLGGWIDYGEQPRPLIAYIFDADFNLTDTLVYSELEENTYCNYAGGVNTSTWPGGEHITPIAKSFLSGTYLLATQIRYPDDNIYSSLVKYDMYHNPIAFTKIEHTPYGWSRPINTQVIDDNTIYHTYYAFDNIYPSIGVVRLNRNLDVVWDVVLPPMANDVAYGHTLTTLPNGNIAVSVASMHNSYSRLYIYFINDGDPTNTAEMAASEMPYTLYPNPVKDLLTLRFDDGDEPESVELYDLAGRLVGTKPNGLESIDMRAMPSGVYMLRVTMKDETIYHEKVLKE